MLSARKSPGEAARRRSRPRPRLRIRRILPWLAVCAVAAGVTIYAGYKVSLSPPSLHPRAVVFAVAENQVLVDNNPSALLFYAQDHFQEEEYDVYNPKQANELVAYLQSQGPLEAMAAAAGVPGKVVEASGPFTYQVAASNVAATGPQVGPAPGTDADYRLLIDVDGKDPMITLYAQAPTERAARAIVNTARSVLINYVARHERGVHMSAIKWLVMRPLGGTTGGVVDPGANKQLLAVVFGVVFALGAALIISLRRRRFWQARPAWARMPEKSERVDDNLDLWPHTRRVLPWCMAVFMVMLFLVPIDAILSSGPGASGGLPISPTLDRVLLIITVIAWVPKLRSPRRFPTKFTRVHAVMFLFAGLCFLGVALNATDLAVNQEVMPTVKKLFLLLTMIAFFVVAADIIRPGEVKPFLKLLVGLGVLCAIGTIIERQTRQNYFYDVWQGVLPLTKPPEMDVLDDIGRLGVVGPTSEPLELATLLSLVLPFAMIFAIEAKERRERFLYIAAGAIVMAGAIATSRKTAVVAPLVGLVVLIGYRPRVMVRALLIASVPLFITIHVLAPGQLGSVLTELEPSHATAVNTDKVRVQRYDAVRPDIMSHLLLGRGFQSYDPLKYRYLDNEYLGLLIGTGLLGTVTFLCIFGTLFTIGHPLIRGPDRERSTLALPIQTGIAMIMVTCALFDTLSFDHVSYMLFFLAALLLAVRKPSREMRLAPSRPAGRGTRTRRPRRGHEPAPAASRPRSPSRTAAPVQGLWSGGRKLSASDPA